MTSCMQAPLEVQLLLLQSFFGSAIALACHWPLLMEELCPTTSESRQRSLSLVVIFGDTFVTGI